MEMSGSTTSNPVEIDTDLYSRQIGTYGIETMGKLIQMRILIIGMRGVGVETAKNVILAGPKQVVIHDDNIVQPQDLGANFYLTESDIGVTTRANASKTKLAELNPYVNCEVHSGEITEDLLKMFNVVVFTETSLHKLVQFSNICHQHGIAFIAADAYGLAASIFVDFGSSFTIHDPNGEDTKEVIIANMILEDERLVVHTLDDKLLPFQDGDHVSFREIEGFSALNGIDPPLPIQVLGKNSFAVTKIPPELFNVLKSATYERNGIAMQVKVPTHVKFRPLEECLEKPISPGEYMLAEVDLGKFGRAAQLHNAILAMQTVRGNNDQFPEPRNANFIEQTLAAAKQLAAETAKKAEAHQDRDVATEAGYAVVDEVDEHVVRALAAFAPCCISPMAAILGGIVAQECVKFTGKYTPIHQFLYMDFFELATVALNTEVNMMGVAKNRYFDQVSIFGTEFQEMLSRLNIFIVGAGALGCEYIKSLALMGVSTHEHSELTITDMDNIEISNLNRQFLFRKEHVGKPKSLTAGNAAQHMNPALKVRALDVRVGNDTEATFDDKFWDRQACIVNALDNIQARLYVDSKCVWHGKPLFESGTLGTKSNSQVILPHITQSYGDSQDPPEESIPVCTLRNFPHAIEHCLEWARDLFTGFFEQAPQAAETFARNPTEFLRKVPSEGTASAQRDKLQNVKQLLEAVKVCSFQACVDRAVEIFQTRFHDDIAQLVLTFPEDHTTTDGLPFWSGPKRFPQALHFNPEDPLHLDFVHSAANLFAFNVGLEPVRDPEIVRDMARKVAIKPFVSRVVRIKVDETDKTEDGAVDDEDAVKTMMEELKHVPSANLEHARERIQAAEFEKDDDTNFHVDFITACANLRARNYRLPEADRHKCKMIAGKIIPAIATTTAMITGFIGIEFLKLFAFTETQYARRMNSSENKNEHLYRIENFRNGFVNLGIPVWILTEPMPPIKNVGKDFDPIILGPVKARPEGFTPWEKVDLNMDETATIAQVAGELDRLLGVDLQMLLVGSAVLYNAMPPTAKSRARFEQPLLSVLKECVGEEKFMSLFPNGRRYLVLDVSCVTSDTGDDVVIPTVKFSF